MAALSGLENNLNGIDSFLVNIIHDEIVLEASKEHAKLAKKAVERTMTEGC